MFWEITLIKQNKPDPLFGGHNSLRVVHFIHGHKVLKKKVIMETGIPTSFCTMVNT